jgi:hypothetical protein
MVRVASAAATIEREIMEIDGAMEERMGRLSA